MSEVPLYPVRGLASILGKLFFFHRWQRILLHRYFLRVTLKHLCSKIRCQRMKEKHRFPDERVFFFFFITLKPRVE